MATPNTSTHYHARRDHTLLTPRFGDRFIENLDINVYNFHIFYQNLPRPGGKGVAVGCEDRTGAKSSIAFHLQRLLITFPATHTRIRHIHNKILILNKCTYLTCLPIPSSMYFSAVHCQSALSISPEDFLRAHTHQSHPSQVIILYKLIYLIYSSNLPDKTLRGVVDLSAKTGPCTASALVNR